MEDILQDALTPMLRSMTDTWLPSALGSSVLCHYDCSNRATITEAANQVSQLDDLGPRGYDLPEATASQQPITNTRNINGLNVLDFDGVNQELQLNTPGPYLRNVSGALVAAVIQADTITGENGFFEVADDSGTSRLKFQVQNSTISIAGRRLDSDGYVEREAQAIDTNPHLVVAIFDYVNAAWDVSLDGSLDGSQAFQTAGNTSDTDGDDMGLSWRPGEKFDGVIGECIAVENDVTTDTRQRLEGYLAHKWGLAGNLPASHPYKNNPPE